MSMNDKISKFMCLVLRHSPEIIHINMDEFGGWVNVDELINNINLYSKYTLDLKTMYEIVDTDTKGRYAFSDDKTRIRCCQGHSIPWVKPILTICEPPEYLYHGTKSSAWDMIQSTGKIDKCKRHAVHMQADMSKAEQSARRWKTDIPVILKIDAKRMYDDGFEFGVSDNNVWCTDHVPVEYVSEVIELEM